MSKGMVTAVGGLAVYKVIAAATEPESAADGTILVLTSTPMKHYYARVLLGEISAPEVGDVCLLLSDEGSYVPLNRDETFAIYIRSVWQYNGSEWVSLVWRVRKDGAWVVPRLDLYTPGNVHSTLTGGWSAGSVGGEGNSYARVSGSYMELRVEKSNYGGPSYVGIATNKKVDLTNYNRLCVRMKRAGGTGTSYGYRGGADAIRTKTYGLAFPTPVIANDQSVQEIQADISSAEGEYYVIVSGNGGVYSTYDLFYVYEVWLA